MKYYIATFKFILLLFTCCASFAAGASSVRSSTDASGAPCIRLKDAARYYNLAYKTVGDKQIKLASRWTSLLFEKNSRKMWANGILVWLHEPLTSVRKKPAMAPTDFNEVIDPILRQDDYLADAGCRTVILDPGHGGRDPGTRSVSGVNEKDVVLDLALRVRRILVNAGYRVYMTRDNDRFISLEERCRKAGKWRGDLFVSLHMNSSSSPASNGQETFVLTSPGHKSTNDTGKKKAPSTIHPGNQHNEASMILGYYLHKKLTFQLPGTDRGLKRARFMVLKNAPSPAVLVECGFLSNPAEDRLFQTEAHCHNAAVAISEGILDYLNAVKKAKVVQR